MPGRGLVISTRLDPAQSAAFAEFCDRRKLDRSTFLRQLIVEVLEADQLAAAVKPGRVIADEEETS